MKVTIIASGSKGNCIHLQSGCTSILIDAGIAKTKIEQRLIDNGIIPGELTGIFITHAHGDHIKGLPLANKYRIPVFAGEQEWKDIVTVDEDLMNEVDDRGVLIGGSCGDDGWFEVDAFKTHHDAYNPLGYAIKGSCGEKVSVCLDTGKVDNDMLEAMADSDIYIIESNHDPILVENSNYPISTQTRILSDLGHLSNQQAAEALSKLVKGKGEKIYLTHLSSSNNTSMHARAEVMRALREKGLKEGHHYFLEVVSE
ncbi:MBL fold metallo-hydrolase [Bacillus sp. 3255]|uniref:MBL fold metallo-hydrolase n=1 Tax=Bacillus sp. 3255 TaxID=2817904 RepID=UPI00285EB550|nr:MBL fold metallo-hydrolase [Bacillus sp. 3255]MDR6884880.1 phosphoribosyl 1,2-cyclic phosphodiesterase [Bacillus sp. 3255]